ncbi:hypothetical protein J4Q44_G00109040 [Coregonus suidteri]|uniref:Uncharacterized protein n=1 Tax=Coregonus suidteri TaxID=861788 RepID=A0AAN8LVW7_9TELE
MQSEDRVWCYKNNEGRVDLGPWDLKGGYYVRGTGPFTSRAIFQLICILAVIIPTSKGHEQEEMEPNDMKAGDQNKKSKGPAPQIRQKLKKESKKKR